MADPMSATEPANPVAAVRAVLPSLTPAAQAIARIILDDPGVVVRSTITEFSAVSGTSEATIVRTSRALGFSGYSQMRFALAAAVAQQPERLVPGDLAPDDPLTDVIAKVARAESEALADTAAQLDPDQLGEVVSAISVARRVDVYGVAASGLVAADMSQKLLRIGLSSHPFSDAHLALTSAALLKTGDVAVAISCSGRPRCARPRQDGGRGRGAGRGDHQQSAVVAGRAVRPHAGVGREGDGVPARGAGQPDQPVADRGLHLRGVGAAHV